MRRHYSAECIRVYLKKAMRKISKIFDNTMNKPSGLVQTQDQKKEVRLTDNTFELKKLLRLNRLYRYGQVRRNRYLDSLYVN